MNILKELKRGKYSKDAISQIKVFLFAKGIINLEYDLDFGGKYGEYTFEDFVVWYDASNRTRILMGIVDDIYNRATQCDGVDEIDRCIEQIEFLADEFDIEEFEFNKKNKE